MPGLVTSTRRPVDDRTGNYDYEQLLAAEVHEYDTVAVTEDLRLGGVHAQKAWNYLETVFEHDLRLVREGRLRPTEMFGVFARKAEDA